MSAMTECDGDTGMMHGQEEGAAPLLHKESAEALRYPEQVPDYTMSVDNGNLEEITDDSSELKDALWTALDSVECDGSFASDLRLEDINPGLEEEDLGPFGMPLSHAETRRLTLVSRQAPFAKDDETIVSANACKIWEIAADKIRLTHPKWPETQQYILDKVCRLLGVSNGATSVKAQLQKLVIYEPEAMFTPRKDGEKGPQTFATMAITLLCEHEGGDIVATLGGKTLLMRSSNKSRWSSKAFAWYADVLHEVKPIVSGHHVALMYDLVHTGPSVAPVFHRLQAQHSTLVSALSSLKDARSTANPIERLIYLLEHKYNETNLRLDRLKAIDRNRVGALAKAAEESGFAIFLCNVERSVLGTVQDGGLSYVRYKRRGPDEDDYNTDEEDMFHTIDEVIEETVEVKHVIGLDGTFFAKAVNVGLEDIIQSQPYEDREYDDEEYEGYDGSYGPTTTQWYRDTGLLIMSQDSVMDFVLKNLSDIKSILQQELKKFQLDRTDTAQRDYIVSIIEAGLRKDDLRLEIHDFHQLLEASLAVRRLDLFLGALDHFRGKPDDHLMAIVTREVEHIGFDVLRPRQVLWLDRWVHTTTGLSELRALLLRLTQSLDCSEEPHAYQFNAWKLAKIESWITSKQWIRGTEIPDVLSAVCEIGNKNDVLSQYIMPLVRQQHGNIAFVLDFGSQLQACVQNKLLSPDFCLPALRNAADIAAGSFTFTPPPVTQTAPSLADSLHHPQANFYTRYETINQPRPESDDILKLVKLLIDVKLPEQYDALLRKLAAASKELQTDALENVMLPFLRDFLAFSRQNSRDWCSVSTRTFYAEVLTNFIMVALGPQPPVARELEPRQVGCGCATCKALDKFLTDDSNESCILHVYAPERKHLESRLPLLRSRGLVRFQLQSVGRSTVALQITKTTGCGEFQTWIARRAAVRKEINLVGSWEEMKELLGDRFVGIVCMAKLIPRLHFPERVPTDLPQLLEPERSKAWIRECLMPYPDATIDQQELWDVYIEIMAAVPSTTPPLSAVEFCGLVPMVWPEAMIQGGERPVVIGVRRWEKWKDGLSARVSNDQASDATGSRTPLAPISNAQERPAVLGEAQPANALKRKAKVIDGRGSP